jgi:hypothetical protein
VANGTVNAAAGPVTDTLFVNDSSGNGRARRLVADRTSPFEVRMERTPLGGRQFVLYAWKRHPRPDGLSPLLFDLGSSQSLSCTASARP